MARERLFVQRGGELPKAESDPSSLTLLWMTRRAEIDPASLTLLWMTSTVQ